MAYPFPFVAGNVLTAAELNAIEPQLSAGLLTSLVSGAYYGTPFVSVATGTVSVVGNLTLTPIYVPATTTFDRISINAGSPVTNPTSVRLGIYDNLAGKPNNLSLDAGVVSVTTANTGYEITISKSLTAGWYWLAAVNQTVASSTALHVIKGWMGSGISRMPALASTDNAINYVKGSITGVLPATVTPITAINDNAIKVFLRAV